VCGRHAAQVLLFSIMFTLRTSVLPPLSAVGAIVAILTDNDGESLTGGAVGGGQTTRTVTTVYLPPLPPTYGTYTA
jgi:hypothetical protein